MYRVSAQGVDERMINVLLLLLLLSGLYRVHGLRVSSLCLVAR